LFVERRRFLRTIAGTILAAPVAAEGQQAGKVPRIGILDPGIPHLFAAFRDAMRQRGYVEGQNIAFEVRSAQGRPEQIRGLAAELVKLGPDVIVSAANLPLNALKQETKTIPIVAAAIGDAVAAGLIKNLAKPDGNITGLSFLNTELSGKRLEVLRQTFPKIRRVAMLNDFNNAAGFADETAHAAKRLGVHLQRIDVRSPDDFERAFDATRRDRADAIDVLASAFFNAHRVQIVKLVAGTRLPAIYESREYAEAGGLMTYGQNLDDLFRRAAVYVDKILKGARPADLPMEQPTKFELVINLKTAKALGLTIPQSLLQRADQVIE
jgi:putative ABC transport system substrate-binding protein